MMFCKFPEIPVGGRLKFFLKEWEMITDDQWVLSTIKEGLKLDFITKPPYTGVKQTNVTAQNLDILLQEVNALLEKGAIEPVPQNDIQKGFYSTFFLVPKKVRRFTASDKFTPSQQVSQETAFQNGLFKHSFETSSARRLGDFSRFEGCLFAYPNVSSSQKVSTILHSGQSLPVQLPLFWPNGSPKGIHQIGNSNSGLSQDAKCPFSGVFGRLVYSESNKKDADCRQREIAQSPSETRIHSQSGEILVNTKSVSDLHRGSFSFRQRSCLPNSRGNFKDQTGNSGFKERNDSSELSSAFRSDGITHRTSPKCSTIHEASSAPSASFLETSNHGPSDQSSSQLSFTKPFKVVAESKQLNPRQKVLPRAKLKNHNDRCLKARLWESFRRSDFSRNLVRTRKDITH